MKITEASTDYTGYETYEDDFIVVNKTNKVTIDVLQELVKKNMYIKNCKSNKKKDPSSLSYLIKRNMSQSDCIKLGTGIEKLVSDIVLQYTTFENVKEYDHLFIDKTKKVLYYAEFKANINLDTDKSKEIYKKCLSIVDDLKKNFSGYTIEWCLLALRYIDNECIVSTIKKKYLKISENVYGINNYLKMMGIDFKFSEETYASYLNIIADEMFTESP